MAIIALRGWYIEKYEPIEDLRKRPHDIRLSKNSLLKSGLRADFLEESAEIERTDWFNRYLAGERVEFYIEGSGGYAISNIDLSSHEIYFTKQDVLAHLEPKIFLSRQTSYPDANESLQEQLETFITEYNRKSRIPLTLELSQRPLEGTMRLSAHQMRQIRKSLLVIADTTPLAETGGDESQLLPSPNVCVELGYALQSKPVEHILLTRQNRPELSGQYPFDVPTYQQLDFNNAAELERTLPTVIEAMLQRFRLVS
ncbi:hypothetical protein [Baaleninema sp.]|uniref:hypothetical protein n=1 Tax=Baaleninema sp. TaxID=3101197 RepID=UPI003CFD4F92